MPLNLDSELEWRQFLADVERVIAGDPENAEARRGLREARRMLKELSPQLFMCPGCKQKRGVSISYGFPTQELFEAAARNEAVIGGCMQEIGAPDRQCLACGHQWQLVRRRVMRRDLNGVG